MRPASRMPSHSLLEASASTFSTPACHCSACHRVYTHCASMSCSSMDIPHREADHRRPVQPAHAHKLWPNDLVVAGCRGQRHRLLVRSRRRCRAGSRERPPPFPRDKCDATTSIPQCQLGRISWPSSAGRFCIRDQVLDRVFFLLASSPCPSSLHCCAQVPTSSLQAAAGAKGKLPRAPGIAGPAADGVWLCQVQLPWCLWPLATLCSLMHAGLPGKRGLHNEVLRAAVRAGQEALKEGRHHQRQKLVRTHSQHGSQGCF